MNIVRGFQNRTEGRSFPLNNVRRSLKVMRDVEQVLINLVSSIYESQTKHENDSQLSIQGSLSQRSIDERSQTLSKDMVSQRSHVKRSDKRDSQLTVVLQTLDSTQGSTGSGETKFSSSMMVDTSVLVVVEKVFKDENDTFITLWSGEKTSHSDSIPRTGRFSADPVMGSSIVRRAGFDTRRSFPLPLRSAARWEARPAKLLITGRALLSSIFDATVPAEEDRELEGSPICEGRESWHMQR